MAVRLDVGRYQVDLASMGGKTGVASVSAAGSRAQSCDVTGWTSGGADEVVGVTCHAPGGRAADAPFAVQWSSS